MKKSLIALAVLGAVAGVAQAQTNVTIYGTLDAGFTKNAGDSTDTTLKIGRGDNNKLGFKGTEDLGGGLKATFQIEHRFDPDTGNVESSATEIRPMWQGRSTVGLAGAFGAVKLGRDLTAVQAANAAFDPFQTTTVGSFNVFGMGKFNSDALTGENAQNRFSNAIFYSSPVISGFQANVAVATKEGPAAGAAAGTNLPANAYSLAATYNNGPIAAMLGYERNGVEDKFWQLAGAYNIGVANLMATYAQTKFGATPALGAASATTGIAAPVGAANTKTNSWMIGADVVAGPGNVKVGYGQSNPAGANNTAKKFAIGYWYSLSKRTYVYADAANTRTDLTAGGTTNVRAFDLGVHHNF